MMEQIKNVKWSITKVTVLSVNCKGHSTIGQLHRSQYYRSITQVTVLLINYVRHRTIDQFIDHSTAVVMDSPFKEITLY
jgi:hypothetical protein